MDSGGKVRKQGQDFEEPGGKKPTKNSQQYPSTPHPHHHSPTPQVSPQLKVANPMGNNLATFGKGGSNKWKAPIKISS